MGFWYGFIIGINILSTKEMKAELKINEKLNLKRWSSNLTY